MERYDIQVQISKTCKNFMGYTQWVLGTYIRVTATLPIGQKLQYS